MILPSTSADTQPYWQAALKGTLMLGRNLVTHRLGVAGELRNARLHFVQRRALASLGIDHELGDRIQYFAQFGRIFSFVLCWIICRR